MRMLVKMLTIMMSTVLITAIATAQPVDTIAQLQQIAAPYTTSVQTYTQKLNDHLDKDIQQQLHILYKAESKLLNRLQQTDSSKTKLAIPDYQTYVNNIQTKAKALTSSNNLNNYIPQLDSVHTSLKFLDTKKIADQLHTKDALKSITDLQNKFQYAGAIQQVLKDKQQQYKQLLSTYTNIPNRLQKRLNKYTEKIYYYKQQIQEYKDELNNPEKLQQKAMSILRELPAFQTFMRKNSFLSSIFLTENPTDINDPSLAGLQRRTVVEAQIQNQIAGGGPNAQNMVQQNIQQAKEELSKLKDKLQQQGEAADLDMPNFKPNTQKTKSFFNRLEYGFNLQNTGGNSLLPNMSDIAITVGYKLNDKSVMGIGTSYKLGLGTGLDNIKLTGEGISLRSYIDYKLKGTFYISGGYEKQYLQRFDNMRTAFNNIHAWQQSGLIGISKIQKLGKKRKAK
ncbi:MAG TPA: hypothetical protein PK772_08755, partial [Chitinophagaceae bacterium]|nr:hypothetical protein [Chitinophagaceae bacterium]